MAQIPFRLKLTSRGFPYLSELQGRTVVIPLQDLEKPAILTETLADNVTIPEIYYCHNVIPTNQGYQSVAYRPLCNPPSDTDGTFTTVLVIRDGNGNKGYLGITSSGRNYMLRSYLSDWIRLADIATSPAGGSVTAAYVSGVTYIYYEGVGCYTYNFATDTLSVQALTGVVAADIKGLVAASGYLLAYGATDIVWSSEILPTDFTPSLITGAGGGAVQDLRGIITTVIPYKLGFIVYSQYNIVVGLYSGNSRYPFNLKGVEGSGGLSDARYVDIDPVTGDHYAYTTSGLQLVTTQVTNTVFQDLTDFLAGSYYETFDETTDTFTTSYLTAPMSKAVTSVSDRYVLFSYGAVATSKSYAIVYDTGLKRFGKLKLDHVDCFEYLLLGTDAVDAPRNSVAFLQADGTIQVASFSINAPYSAGVLILGKYQLDRAKTTTLVSLDIENMRADSSFTCTDLYTLDGKNTTAAAGYLADYSGMYRQYTWRQPGINHSLLFKGSFNLVSAVMKVVDGGYR